MTNARISKADSGAHSIQGSCKFTGTCNPRHIRALRELVRCNFVWRESLDDIAGTSNSPDLVAALRRRGLDLPCERVVCADRDGRESRPGRYSLTAADRRMVLRWLTTQPGGYTA